MRHNRETTNRKDKIMNIEKKFLAKNELNIKKMISKEIDFGTGWKFDLDLINTISDRIFENLRSLELAQ